MGLRPTSGVFVRQEGAVLGDDAGAFWEESDDAGAVAGRGDLITRIGDGLRR